MQLLGDQIRQISASEMRVNEAQASVLPTRANSVEKSSRLTSDNFHLPSGYLAILASLPLIIGPDFLITVSLPALPCDFCCPGLVPGQPPRSLQIPHQRLRAIVSRGTWRLSSLGYRQPWLSWVSFRPSSHGARQVPMTPPTLETPVVPQASCCVQLPDLC